MQNEEDADYVPRRVWLLPPRRTFEEGERDKAIRAELDRLLMRKARKRKPKTRTSPLLDLRRVRRAMP